MTKTATSETQRWTRDYLFDILHELEVGCLFGVPGTNEIPIIDGCFTRANEAAKRPVRYVECLHENIAVGAAMGYARMTGKPGVVEVHVTPGIGHSLGNLFNAARSRMPLVILCGQQQNELVTQEPLLASNLVQVAAQYTKWAYELRSWEETALVLQRAFKEALAVPTGPVFISLPWDFTIHEIPDDARVPPRVTGVTRIPSRFTGDSEAVKSAAAILSRAERPVIIAGDAVGASGAWAELGELAELLGAPVWLEGFSSMANFPNTDPHWQGELPGAQADTQQRLAQHDVAFLCGFGLQAQLAVFKYADGPLIPPGLKLIYLTNNTWDIGKNYFGEAAILGDIKATLPSLNALVRANPPATAAANNAALRQAAAKRQESWDAYVAKAWAQPKIWGVLVADALRQLIEEHGLQKKFVYVHEAVSDAASFQMLLPFGEQAAPTSYYCVGGGSLGWSMPASLGIKLAGDESLGITPDLVINAVGDGSSLFYPQIYWTAAHKRLSVLYVVMNNRAYRTLQVGLGQVVEAYKDPPYAWKPVTMSPSYLRIEDPHPDFLEIARSFGIPHGRVVHEPRHVKEALAEGIQHVLAGKGSFVIDMRLDPSSPLKPTTPQPLAPVSFAEVEPAAVEGEAEAPPLDFYYFDGEGRAPGGHRNKRVIF